MDYKSTETNLEKKISSTSEREIPENSIQKSKPKVTKLIIIIIFLLLVIICLIGLFIYYQGFKNKHENYDKEEESKDSKEINDDEIINTNKIKAAYQIEEGKNFSFFNNDEANLKINDFIIIKKSFSEKNLRNLEIKEMEIIDINFTPKETGNLTIEISFNINLTSLNAFFKANKNLLKIDLKDFNMEEVKSMESTFSGCSNLFEVDLEGVNSQNLIIMNNTFEKCKKLKKVNLSLKNASKFLEINNIFSDCESLEYINLSSLQYIDDNMFKGIKSNPTIYANDLISNQLDYIFHISLNLTINIIVTFNNSNNDCIKGNGEKCKDCSVFFEKHCATCNDGYYLPFNSLNREKCLPCNIIDNCASCIGNENNIFCFTCKPGFNLKNNKCEKVDVLPPFCQIGENELCKSCKSDKNLRNECDSCNEGYYLASDSERKTVCENCNKIKFCIECYGTINNPICSKCENGFKLENNSCLEETCILGTDDRCKTCKKETGKKMECETCNEGYYLEENKISYKCSKCRTKNCKSCYSESGYEICMACENNFILIKDDNDISSSCICPTYYELTEENICIKTGNWIEAEYNIRNINYKYDLNLFYNGNNAFKINDVEAYINNTKIQLSQFDSYFCYNFSKSGYYKIKINFKTTLYDMYFLFNIGSLRRLKFLPGFDSSKVTSMRGIFNGQFIEYLDLNYLNTDNVINMQSFAYDSENLISLDLSKFNTSKLKNMRDMFVSNIKLKEIDFSSFDTSSVTQCESLFQDYPKDLEIKISNKFTRCKEFIPFDVKVINIDELACKDFEHCKKCKGSKSSLTCTVCESGYELRQNKCVLPNCTIGINEKCYNCNQNTNECLTCNSGYYLPINSKNKTVCTKCKIENCDECDNITGNCRKCKLFYKPIFNEYNSKIILCQKMCEFGEGNKCSSCDENNENKCLSCNFGYKLMKNGTCSKIENSLIAIYNVDTTSKYIKLLGTGIKLPNFELSDIEIFIDSNKIDFRDCFYLNLWLSCKFQKTGLIEVKIIIKKTLTSLSNLFSNCQQLVSVKFSETFDTSYVLNLENMFYNCLLLKNVDLSSFNTTLVSKLIFMFYDCHQLTSIDLSNFDTRNVLSFQDMFKNNYNLKWVDISNFNTSNSYIPAYADYLFKGVTGIGTIIINKKSYNKDVPSGWNIIYKD